MDGPSHMAFGTGHGKSRSPDGLAGPRAAPQAAHLTIESVRASTESQAEPWAQTDVLASEAEPPFLHLPPFVLMLSFIHHHLSGI